MVFRLIVTWLAWAGTVLSNMASCTLPAPLEVRVVSFNLEHTLTWLPAPGTPLTALYRVEYCDSSKKCSWIPVTLCTRVATAKSCDLTDLFIESISSYTARVQAFTPAQVSMWTHSLPFCPLLDTILGPPQVSVTGCGDCLRLHITPPTSRGFRHSRLLQRISEFTCQVWRTRDHVQIIGGMSSSQDTLIKYLEPGVEYCVTAAVSVSFKMGVVRSQPQCAFTSPPPVHKGTGMLSVMCMVCLMVAVFCGSFCYRRRILALWRTLPEMLPSVPFPGNNPTLSVSEPLPLACARTLNSPECSGGTSVEEVSEEDVTRCSLLLPGL